MSFPAFYDAVPRLFLRDPLAELLGAAEGGLIEYGYADAVRLAGHSCPTVAGTYVLLTRMLRRLHGDELPVRGGLRVEFRDTEDDGVTGVVGSVFGLITGAAGAGGFKGLGGKFGRRGLLTYAVPGLIETLRLTRLDTGASCEASIDLAVLPGDPRIGILLPAALVGGEPVAKKAFADAWQGRVQQLLERYFDAPELVRFRA